MLEGKRNATCMLLHGHIVVKLCSHWVQWNVGHDLTLSQSHNHTADAYHFPVDALFIIIYCSGASLKCWQVS